MRTSWLVGALASSVLGAGCAHQGSTREEAELGRLSMDQKQEVFTAQHNESVAEANLAKEQEAKDQAKAFKMIANDEVKSARSRLDAAEKSVVLGRQTGSTQTMQQEAQVAERQLAAARIKADYADRLLGLRDDELALAQRQLDAARAEGRLAKLTTLDRAGMPLPDNLTKARRARDDITSDVARREREIASRRQEVEATRTAWETARRSYNVAARDNPVPSAIQPPRQPEMVRPTPMPESP